VLQLKLPSAIQSDCSRLLKEPGNRVPGATASIALASTEFGAATTSTFGLRQIFIVSALANRPDW